ncbi:hypothetical protein AB0L67_41925 [Streptomyces flaveolus]|uniref:hypothetical protein n=1 Tax=Streptomyces flaveolus TaxID=67297 RepID=UPI003417C0E3
MRNLEEGRGPTSTVSADMENGARGSTYFDLTKKLTFSATMSIVSAGYALKNRELRGFGGFGMLAVYNAEKAVEAGFKDPATAVASGVNALGTAVWAVGIGTGNSIAQSVGPAVNFAANIASAGLAYYQKRDGWLSKVADTVEMAAFTVAGATDGNPIARGTAFAAAGAAFLADAPHDPALLGHAVGTGVWSVGAFLQSDLIQSIGAGAVALAEVARVVCPAIQARRNIPSTETTPQQSGSESTPVPGVTSSTAIKIGQLPFETCPSFRLNSVGATAVNPVTRSATAESMASGQDVPATPRSVASAASMPVAPPPSLIAAASTAALATSSLPMSIPSNPIASVASGPTALSAAAAPPNPVAAAVFESHLALPVSTRYLPAEVLTTPSSIVSAQEFQTPTRANGRRNGR